MSMLWNRLREKSGASIFMGLIFLLVCLTVGTVALTASTAAAGKLAQQRQREQDYLTVASAARLVKKRIGAVSYTHTKTTYSDGRVDEFTRELTPGDVILKKELEEWCQILVENPSSLGDTGKPFEINLDSAGGASAVEWKTVYGSLNMKADGRILVELWLGAAAKDDPQNYNRMKIEFIPDGPVIQTEYTSEEPTPGTIVVITTVKTTYSWPEGGCTITKGK